MAVVAEGLQQFDDEEGRPAGDEAPHDDAERLGGAPLLVQRDAVLTLAPQSPLSATAALRHDGGGGGGGLLPPTL